MSTSKSGDNWTVEVTDGIMIWEFLPGMELLAFQEEAYPVYEDLLESHNLNGMVTDVQLDDPFNEDTFEVWEKSAKRAKQGGLNKWGVVADGIKAISLSGKIDIDGLDTLSTDDRTEAVEWAKE